MGLVGGNPAGAGNNATVANRGRGRGQFPVSRVYIASMVQYVVPRLRPLPLGTYPPSHPVSNSEVRTQHVPALPSHCIRWLDGPCLDGPCLVVVH